MDGTVTDLARWQWAAERFAAAVLAEQRKGLGDLDGGTLQDLATRAGLLGEVEVPVPCAPDCRCVEYHGADGFPAACIRLTAAGRWLLGTTKASNADGATVFRLDARAIVAKLVALRDQWQALGWRDVDCRDHPRRGQVAATDYVCGVNDCGADMHNVVEDLQAAVVGLAQDLQHVERVRRRLEDDLTVALADVDHLRAQVRALTGGQG
jgi:hypothetical protein